LLLKNFVYDFNLESLNLAWRAAVDGRLLSRTSGLVRASRVAGRQGPWSAALMIMLGVQLLISAANLDLSGTARAGQPRSDRRKRLRKRREAR